MIYVLIAVAVIAAAVMLLGIGGGYLTERLDKNKSARVACEHTLNEVEKTLRNIANGAGNPVLEAQIGLDEIVSIKEELKSYSLV